MKIFKKTKKVELTAEELVNIKLNKEKLVRAGFGHISNFHEIVMCKSIYVLDELLKSDWQELKEKILKEAGYDDTIRNAVKKRLEV